VTDLTRLVVSASVVLVALLIAGGLRPAAADSLPPTLIYGIASDNNIYSVDPGTGAIIDTISTASLGLSGTLANAFALNRARAQVYFLGTDKNLYFWDRPSGALGQVATAAQLGISETSMPRNATFFEDRFWFIIANDNQLRSASLSYGPGGLPTGVALQPPLGITGVSGFLDPDDIAYDDVTRMLYGSDLPAATNTFFQIDMTSLVGDRPYTSLYSQPGGIGVQLAFDNDYSTLFGANFVTGQWYTVDTTLGGTFNVTGGAVTPDPYRMRDLAGGLAPVPEPGALELAGCAVFTTGCLVSWRRRGRSG